MIYMALDETRNAFFCKIGQAHKVADRMAQYRTHSPSVTILCACAGTNEAEQIGHAFLREHGSKVHGEWFAVSETFYNECKDKGLTIIPKFQKKHITWY